MVAPLKVGLAGLGTVGASVVRLIAEQRAALALRCGRPIEIVAVTARSRGKDRGIDLKSLRWVADPVKLATDPGIDVFVELIGGDGNPARAAVSAALKAGKSVVTANKALLARARRRARRRSPRSIRPRSTSRPRSAGAIPDREDAARRTCPATRSSASMESSTAPATTS